MSSQPPTLFVGLGGSGLLVLSMLKRSVRRTSQVECQPLAFCGFDLRDREDCMRDGHFAPDEAHYLDPAPIANCVRAIKTSVSESGSSQHQGGLSGIRLWYPDPGGTAIQYSQTSGPGQWRPLGRVGFVVHSGEIFAAIDRALTKLGSVAAVYIICSLAGGAGSGMLLDVAANLRKMTQGSAIYAVLLLPEYFDHVDIGGRIRANAYATLRELTNATVFQRALVADYPRIPAASAEAAENALDRLYVTGPYVGDARPFWYPREAAEYLAEQLLQLAREPIVGSKTYTSNVDVGSLPAPGDFSSRGPFCCFAAGEMQLLDSRALAALTIQRLAWEAGSGECALFDLLVPSAPPAVADALLGEIEARISVEQALELFNRPGLETSLRDALSPLRLDHLTAAKALDLQRVLRQFCGDFLRPPTVVRTACATARDIFADRISHVREDYAGHPVHYRRLLMGVRDDILKRLGSRPDWPPIPAVEGLDLSLGTSLLDWIFGASFLRQRLPSLLDDVLEAMERRFLPAPTDTAKSIPNGVLLYQYELRQLAASLLHAEIEADDFRWRRAATIASPFGVTDESAAGGATLGSGRVRATVCITSNDLPSVIRRCQAVNSPSALGTEERSAQPLRAIATEFYRYIGGSVFKAQDMSPVDEIGRIFDEWLFGQGLGVPCSGRLISPMELYDAVTIERLVLSCRTPVFENGRVDARSSLRIARVTVPRRVTDMDRTANYLFALCNELLETKTEIVNADSDYVSIVMEDLFRSAQEIAGIYDYHSDYYDTTRHSRLELFHIDRRLPKELPPLLPGIPKGPTHCGNAACDFDLRSVPRGTLFCPRCGRPIRRRCGNAGCTADDLDSRPGLSRIVESGFCPDCRKELLTYWWHCPRHSRRVPMDKPHCPDCVHERLSPGQIARRPSGGESFICPGCLWKGLSNPFVATDLIAEACRRGVNGQDTRSVEETLNARLPGGAHCPRCGSKIVPICPLKQNGLRHYLYRPAGSERWNCYHDHTGTVFFRCHSCEFPVLESDTACPRCGAPLEDCWLCTPEHGVRIPRAPRGAPCPRCGLPRNLDLTGPSSYRSSSGRFCSNIYGCRVGSRLDSVLFPFAIGACPACGIGPLLEGLSRNALVSSCAFCRRLFTSLADSTIPARATAGACRLCGQGFEETARLVKNSKESATALAIVRALGRHKDDASAFRAILESVPSSERNQLDRHLETLARSLADTSVRKVAEPRIDAMLQLFRQHFGARKNGGSSEPPEQDGPKTNDAVAPAESTGQPMSTEALLESDYIIGLGDDEDAIRSWVEDIFGRSVSRERFESALGGTVHGAKDDLTRKRLERLREIARAIFDALETLS